MVEDDITPRDYTPEDAAADRYTKDLENMLGCIIIIMESQAYCPFCLRAIHYERVKETPVTHTRSCPLTQSKALLERTGYTGDF